MFAVLIQNLIALVVGFVGLGFHVADKPVISGLLMFATLVLAISELLTISILMSMGKFFN